MLFSVPVSNIWGKKNMLTYEKLVGLEEHF